MVLGNFTTRLNEQFLSEVAPDGSAGRFRLLLFDFDTGRSELGARHVQALQQYVLPRVGPDQPRQEVWIGGIASRRGDSRFNHGLAWARAAEVEQFLRNRVRGLGALAGRHSLRTTWHGERYSVGQSENSAYYRSVLVVMTQGQTYHPPPPPPTPAQLYRTNRFRIRWDFGGDGELGVSAGVHTYVIDYELGPDSPQSDPMWYRFVGVGIGLGIAGGAGDPRAPWNSFVSQRVTTTRDFAGSARLTSLGIAVGRHGTGHTKLTLRADLLGESIRIDPFHAPNAFSFAAGLGSIVGPFWPDFEYSASRSEGG